MPSGEAARMLERLAAVGEAALFRSGELGAQPTQSAATRQATCTIQSLPACSKQIRSRHGARGVAHRTARASCWTAIDGALDQLGARRA
jgi:hypothetical protein